MKEENKMMLILAILGFLALVIFFGLYFPRLASTGCGIYFFFKLGIAAILEQYIGNYAFATVITVILVIIFLLILIMAFFLDLISIKANPFKK